MVNRRNDNNSVGGDGMSVKCNSSLFFVGPQGQGQNVQPIKGDDRLANMQSLVEAVQAVQVIKDSLDNQVTDSRVNNMLNSFTEWQTSFAMRGQMLLARGQQQSTEASSKPVDMAPAT